MALKKNTTQGIKNTEILEVFQAHFTGHLNLARIRLISMFIMALCKVRSVNYSKLAGAFGTDCGPDSNFRRIQRFMAQVDLPVKLVASFIFALLPQKENLVLVIQDQLEVGRFQYKHSYDWRKLWERSVSAYVQNAGQKGELPHQGAYRTYGELHWLVWKGLHRMSFGRQGICG